MPPTRQLVVELLAEGHCVMAVANTLGLAEPTVSYHVNRLRSEPVRSPAIRLVAIEDVRSQVLTRGHVAELLTQGLSRVETAQQLGLSKATVSYHARRLGLPVDERGARRYDWEAIQRYYDRGYSVRQCKEAFGFSHKSWHSAMKRGTIVTRPQTTPTHELFVAARPRNRGNLKRRLLAEGLKPKLCANCGISDWEGQPLSLALHHINGNRHDNRVTNLQLLCPNCHSQTDNYSGRNGRGREPSAGATVR